MRAGFCLLASSWISVEDEHLKHGPRMKIQLSTHERKEEDDEVNEMTSCILPGDACMPLCLVDSMEVQRFRSLDFCVGGRSQRA